jgi:hypothetical protein
MKKKHMHVVPNVNPRFKNLRLVSFPNRIWDCRPKHWC